MLLYYHYDVHVIIYIYIWYYKYIYIIIIIIIIIINQNLEITCNNYYYHIKIIYIVKKNIIQCYIILPLVNVYIANWKITIFKNGKSTIKVPCSIAMKQITRGYYHDDHDDDRPPDPPGTAPSARPSACRGCGRCCTRSGGPSRSCQDVVLPWLFHG